MFLRYWFAFVLNFSLFSFVERNKNIGVKHKTENKRVMKFYKIQRKNKRLKGIFLLTSNTHDFPITKFFDKNSSKKIHLSLDSLCEDKKQSILLQWPQSIILSS